MDNVTHSLAGLVLAESAVQLRARSGGSAISPRLRTGAALASMVAANLPDADLAYTGFGNGSLTYLLHHRGHTHTIVIAVLGAVLLWAGVLLVRRWRAAAGLPRDQARWLFALLLVSTLSHLLLDWTNSYGVHPFWPFDNAWRYGDAVFIVEPWFWVVTVPTLALATRFRVARFLLWGILAIGLVLAWRVALVSPWAAAALTVGAGSFVMLARSLGPGPRVAAAVVAWVTVTLVMAGGAALGRRAIERAVRTADPGAELLDVVVTPLPANPVCSSIMTVERKGPAYRAFSARVSGIRGIPVERCASRGGAGPMFRPATRTDAHNVAWDGEWSAGHAELATLARESCPALAALRFIRVPAWRSLDDSTLILGDARFGGGSGRSFADVRVPRRSTTCPPAVPPWTPPRADLLGGA